MLRPERPQGLIRHNKAERAVPGLRDKQIASPVKVFKANPDGTKGELIRIEHEKGFTTKEYSQMYMFK